MKARNIFGALAAASLLLLGACSEETAVDINSAITEGAEGVVRFSINASGTSTRAEYTTLPDYATDDEKAVKTVYAVAFKDASATSSSKPDDGATAGEEAGDTFVKWVNVELTDDLTSEQSFKLGTGYYQICFVVNPSDALVAKIKALTTTSTVSAFKALVEERDPANKENGMLMTGEFYAAAVKAGGEVSLNTVYLTRVMARIDIINQADGITITKATLNNRAKTTVLISDSTATTAASSYENKEYTLSLVGNSLGITTANADTANIYTYEQYQSEGSVVSMDLEYTVDGVTGKTYKHNVAFTTTTGADAATTTTQIPMKRNRLYKVYIGNKQGKLIFTISAVDWTKGTEFAVSVEELASGLTD